MRPSLRNNPAGRSLARRLALLIAALALLAVPSCAAQPVGISADLGQQVALSPGQDVSIKGESLTIEFAEVISDSRCPTGAT